MGELWAVRAGGETYAAPSLGAAEGAVAGFGDFWQSHCAKNPDPTGLRSTPHLSVVPWPWSAAEHAARLAQIAAERSGSTGGAQ